MVDKRSVRFKIGTLLYGLAGLIALYGFFLIGSQYFGSPIDAYRTRKIAEELRERYGLVVGYGDPSDFRIPPEPVAHTLHNMQMEPTNIHGAYNAILGIKEGLSKYPPKLIKKNLSAVFISGRIKSDRVVAGGTVLGSWIYVSAGKNSKSIPPHTYAETLHHEFSSILKREYNFPTIRWVLANKSGFKYPEEKKKIIKAASLESRADPKDAHEWHDAGFVHDYGMSSIVNDFNTYAELAMGNPEKLKLLSKQYPRIMLKTAIFVEYYEELAPELREYFHSVGLDDILSLVSE